MTEEYLDGLENVELSDNKVFYEIWLVGDDENDVATDFDYLIDDIYSDLNEAMKCFDYFTDAANIKKHFNIEYPAQVSHIYIRLEMCIEDEDATGTTCVEIIKEVEITNFR